MKKSKVLKLDSKSKHLAIWLLRPFADKFILLNVRDKAKKNKVNVDYWKGSPNLGDYISPIIVKHLLSKKGLDPEKTVNSTKHLFAVGSVITAGLQNGTVWGSGILYTTLGYRLKGRKLDIRATRGPLTKMMLCEYGFDAPCVYGDPAVFMKEIYCPKKARKTHKYGIIAHKNGSKYIDNPEVLDGSYKFIDIKTEDYKKFIDDICSVEYVISSSLHGIILAETYGVPAILVKPDYSQFKYYDWYYATGRIDFPIVESLKEVKEKEFLKVPNLDEMRKRLERAFPYDIYE